MLEILVPALNTYRTLLIAYRSRQQNNRYRNLISYPFVLQPPHIDFFQEIYLITELMQSDLHKIIVSPQHLSADHIKVS
jgi:hypothetical protein